MKLVMIKIIFEVLLVPNKRVFRIQVNYVILYRRNGRFQLSHDLTLEAFECRMIRELSVN